MSALRHAIEAHEPLLFDLIENAYVQAGLEWPVRETLSAADRATIAQGIAYAASPSLLRLIYFDDYFESVTSRTTCTSSDTASCKEILQTLDWYVDKARGQWLFSLENVKRTLKRFKSRLRGLSDPNIPNATIVAFETRLIDVLD